MDLSRLSLVKGAGADEPVDLARRQADHLGRRACPLEEPSRRRQHGLVARADGDDTCDELLEGRVETVVRELEHGRLRERRDRLADMLDGEVDVEWGLHGSSQYSVVSSQ